MSKLFVTLFVEDKFCHYGIDELVQNSFNGYINPSLVFGNKNIYLPIKIQDEKYFVSSNLATIKILHNNETFDNDKQLLHRDYLLFSSETITYSALITDSNDLTLGDTLYTLDNAPIFIGRSEESNVVLDLNTYISRKCAAIRTDARGIRYIEDLSGKTGIYVNGIRETAKQLFVGDEIYIMGTTMLYLGDKIVIPTGTRTNHLQKTKEIDILSPFEITKEEPYIRTPRIFKSQETGKIVIDSPPSPQRNKEIPFILSAGPSITMSLAMLASLGVTISNAVNGGGMGSIITSGVMALSMLAGALLWPILLRRYNRRQEAEQERYRQEKYTKYLIDKEQEIKKKYDRNSRILTEVQMPSPDVLKTFIAEKKRQLWERDLKDDDFLLIRLGKGEIEFNIEIQAPNKGFVLEDDAMVDNAIALKEKYKKMQDVPITISLMQKKVVGVVGDVFNILKLMITNIIALHSPENVKLVLVYNATDMKKMQWANDLPHVWSSDKKHRYVATNHDESKALFAGLNEIAQDREENSKEILKSPIYVVLILDNSLVEDVPFKKYLTSAENNVGITTVFFGKRFIHIPKECVAIIQKDEDICGIYVKNENDNRFINFKADAITDETVNALSREMNKIPIKAENSQAAIPNRVAFLDMYRVGNVDALNILNQWKTNISEKSLAAPLGIKAGGEIFLLDIHEKYHGCHGLVAGTTGSGKSEFLQAYILSMMINYSPNEVAFVLVDFKGGDMARPFLKSPHLAATISNLSGNILHRALLSLEAERKRRENIFNKAAEKLGVDKIDINSYHKYFKDRKLTTPLPHLIIVIDEFAQLKSQHSEFMAKLIDIAQVGRSLGIHLILATQRPSGVVDPQIWSNSKFKVCLKVLDKQDSTDMIGRPDAALIKNPGRAYVQVGYDDVFEQIQSGYSGADYIARKEYIDEDSISVNMVNWLAESVRTVKKTLNEKKSHHTQLEEIMVVLTEIGKQQSLKVKQLWLPPLPTELRLEQCICEKLGFSLQKWDKVSLESITLGIIDIPEKQEQKTYVYDFIKQGHVAIYGSSGSGKSTLIQTILFELARRHSPELFNAFVFDFDGSSLANVVAMPHCAKYVSDADEAEVENVLRYIQTIIADRRKLFAQNHCANYESYNTFADKKLPMILLVLDNYAEFREKMYDSEDLLMQIASAARSCGIYLLITGNSKGAIYYKLLEQISEKIVLNMNDSGAYRDILNVPIPILPEKCKGRGLAFIDNQTVEVQFAVPFDIQNESERTLQIQRVYEQMESEIGKVTYDIPEISLMDEQAYTKNKSSSTFKFLEVLENVENAFILGFDYRTGQTKGFEILPNTNIFVGNPKERYITENLINRLILNSKKQCFVATSIEQDNADWNAIVDLDKWVNDICNVSAEEQQNSILVIDGFCEFYDRISDDALTTLEREIGKKRGLSIVTFDNMQRLKDYRDTGLYSFLVRTTYGAIIGGGITDNIAYELSSDLHFVYAEFRKKILENTQAIIYSGDKLAYVDIEGEI